MPERSRTTISDTETTSTDTETPSYRVKLYWLDADGKWEDKGTGFCIYLEGTGSDPDEIFVRSEIDSTPLLNSRVIPQRSYQKQQDTLIVWTEKDNEDLALSFQEADGCDDIWQRICNKQGNEQNTGLLDDLLDDESGDGDNTLQEINETLPQPQLSNLNDIAKILTSVTSLHEKDELASFVLAGSYINKFFPHFEYFERTNNIEGLHTLYTIMNSIIMLNDSSVIEYLIADDAIMSVAGILEYDTRTPNVKANHRQVIQKQSQMELVVPLDDPTTLSKMRQTFRLQYLKDVILGRYLDETLTSMLQSLILFNHVDIIGHIQHNTKFLTDTFDILNQPDATDIQKKKVVQFVLQLCNISRSLQPASRTMFYRTLAMHGYFDIFEYALYSQDEGMRIAGVGALNSIVDMDVSLVRTRILEDTDDKKKNLLECIVDRFITPCDSGLKFQYLEILKMILESNPASPPGILNAKVLRKQDPGIDDILGIFYEKYADIVLRPLQSIENKPMNLDGPIEPLEHDYQQSAVYSHLIEFLCFTIQQHSFRSKYLMLSSDCFPKMTQLYRSPQSSIKLSALRFFRTCVGLLDDFYNRHLIKHNIFESTIRILLDTDGKSNLLNSACLELLEFIRKENPKLLVTHLIEKFGSVLDTVDYISTCGLLRSQYEQNQERTNPSTSLAQSESLPNRDELDVNNKRQSISLDQYEEGYFNESDDDEEDERITENLDDNKDNHTALTEPAPPKGTKRDRDDNKDGNDDDKDDIDYLSSKSQKTHDNDSPNPSRKISFINGSTDNGTSNNMEDIFTYNEDDEQPTKTNTQNDEHDDNQNGNGDKKRSGDVIEDQPPQDNNGDKNSDDDDDDDDGLSSPPSFIGLGRRLGKNDDDDDDDVLAVKSLKSYKKQPDRPPTTRSATKALQAGRKIVIKPQTTTKR